MQTGRTTKYRAVADVHGHRFTGPLRVDPAIAHQDYLEMCARRETGAKPDDVTLGEAVAQVIAAKERSGVCSEHSLESVRRNAGKILSAWAPGTPARAIDLDEITWFVERLLESGLSANTVREKVLPLLKLALRRAGMDWPSEGLPRLPRRAPEMPFFEFAEVRDLIRTIERYEATSESGRVYVPETRQMVADVVALLATTGARVTELHRLQREDVDLAARSLRLVNNKARGRVNVVFYPSSIDERVARLAARAETGPLFPGNGYLSKRLHEWAKRLGEPRFHARAMRHTFITAILEQSGDLAVTRDAARHSNLTMTNRYVHASPQRARAIVEQLDLRPSGRSSGS